MVIVSRSCWPVTLDAVARKMRSLVINGFEHGAAIACSIPLPLQHLQHPADFTPETRPILLPVPDLDYRCSALRWPLSVSWQILRVSPPRPLPLLYDAAQAATKLICAVVIVEAICEPRQSTNRPSQGLRSACGREINRGHRTGRRQRRPSPSGRVSKLSLVLMNLTTFAAPVAIL